MCRRFIATKHVLALVVVVVGFVGGLSLVALAEEQDARQPTLADLMTLAQLRHFKLWYAHKEDNWKLAAYELDLFENTISRVKNLYPKVSSIAQDNLIREKTAPAMAELHRAINDKNNSRFEAAFVKITTACNECHQAAGFDFIVVTTPTRSLYSNQNFKPAR